MSRAEINHTKIWNNFFKIDRKSLWYKYRKMILFLFIYAKVINYFLEKCLPPFKYSELL
jgi:hypothetical protein